jgi:hypothetical protein
MGRNRSGIQQQDGKDHRHQTGKQPRFCVQWITFDLGICKKALVSKACLQTTGLLFFGKRILQNAMKYTPERHEGQRFAPSVTFPLAQKSLYSRTFRKEMTRVGYKDHGQTSARNRKCLKPAALREKTGMWQNSEKYRKTKHLVEGKRCGFQPGQAQGFFVNV